MKKMKTTTKTIFFHKVADFAVWKEVFNMFSGLRQKAGELSVEIGIFYNDPKTAYVINEWKSVAAAKAFLKDSDLTKNMEKVGLIEKPQLLYLVKKINPNKN